MGDKLSSTKLNCNPTMEMVPGSTHIPNSRASSRQEQSSCRQGIQSSKRSLWLDDPFGAIYSNISEDGSYIDLNLFASCLTYQLLCFYSSRPNLLAEPTDSFTLDWSQFHGYANPSWCFFCRVYRFNTRKSRFFWLQQYRGSNGGTRYYCNYFLAFLVSYPLTATRK